MRMTLCQIKVVNRIQSGMNTLNLRMFVQRLRMGFLLTKTTGNFVFYGHKPFSSLSFTEARLKQNSTSSIFENLLESFLKDEHLQG